MHPPVSPRLALLMNPLGVTVLALFESPAVAAFAPLHGAGTVSAVWSPPAAWSALGEQAAARHSVLGQSMLCHITA